VFDNLVHHVDELQDQIGATLAMSSQQTLSPTLAKIGRITSLAHSEVGQLPLSLMPFNDTQEFLSNIGDFTQRLSKQNFNDQPMTDDQYKNLEKLYKRSSDIEQQLRRVQAVASKNNLRWMDVKTTLASGKEPMDNAIIDGFRTMDQKVQGYDDIDWGPENAQMAKDREGKLDDLKGKKISGQQAKQVARKFFGFGPNVNVNLSQPKKGSDYAVYNASMKNPKTGSMIHMNISQIGGYPVWMIQDNGGGKPKISLYQAGQIAAKFLKKHGKANMKITQSEQYDDVGMFTFVKMKNNARIYPESIRMKVALNNGKVTGYDATDYIAFQKNRDFGKPKLTRQQALKNINKNVKVQTTDLAVTTNDLGDEVLCYEILGTIHNDTYRIFINANTGAEEKVKKLQNPQSIYKTA
jgi:spore germination protein